MGTPPPKKKRGTKEIRTELFKGGLKGRAEEESKQLTTVQIKHTKKGIQLRALLPGSVGPFGGLQTRVTNWTQIPPGSQQCCFNGNHVAALNPLRGLTAHALATILHKEGSLIKKKVLA